MHLTEKLRVFFPVIYAVIFGGKMEDSAVLVSKFRTREGVFDISVFPLGKTFDIKIGKNVKSPLGLPLPWGLILTGALLHHSSYILTPWRRSVKT